MVTNDLSSVQSLAGELYSYLARRFPVCCLSDEFIHFPQAVEESRNQAVWDDLTPDSIEDAVSFIRAIRDQISQCHDGGAGVSVRAGKLISLLKWHSRTLEEQFTIVKQHTTQPTFVLTLVIAGLVEVMKSGDDRAASLKFKTIPRFLKKSFSSLSHVPALYRDLGVQMAGEVIRWLPEAHSGPAVGDAIQGVKDYREQLIRMPVKENFHLPPDLLERVVKYHTGSGLNVSEAMAELLDEAATVRRGLVAEAKKLGYGHDWEAAFKSIRLDPLPPGGKRALLRSEVNRLQEHCRSLGLMIGPADGNGDLTIEHLPSSLVSIRSADSYSALPGHPFRGGVFYIFGGGTLGAATDMIHSVYRMTAAHETYPGHHLMDCCRWNNVEPALRPVEYPLFYEGWACFGEDLMFQTGAFDQPFDRLILLRRRFRHAVRGMVDLRIHTRADGFEKAASELAAAGFDRDRALETVRKYALRPAYQMCYTVGRRRFQRLFESFGQRDIAGFANTVLKSGELLFGDLERVLQQTMGHGDAETRRHGE